MRYYLLGNGDTFVEAAVAPPTQTTYPMKAVETAVSVGKGFKSPSAQVAKTVIKTVFSEATPEYGVAQEASKHAVAIALEWKKKALEQAARTGTSWAAERTGFSPAVKAIESSLIGRVAPKVYAASEVMAMPVVAAYGGWKMYETASEFHETAEAMKKAAEEEELAERTIIRAEAAARRGERGLRTQEELLEKLPRVLRRYEQERENRESEARFLQRQIEELEKKKVNKALEPREAWELWSLRNKRDAALERMEDAARIIYAVTTAPLAMRLRWLAEQEAVAQERGW